MIDIDKNLEIFYKEENKEDTYIGAISKHECVVDGWFVIELMRKSSGCVNCLVLMREVVMKVIANDAPLKGANTLAHLDYTKTKKGKVE